MLWVPKTPERHPSYDELASLAVRQMATIEAQRETIAKLDATVERLTAVDGPFLSCGRVGGGQGGGVADDSATCAPYQSGGDFQEVLAEPCGAGSA
ncbi:hypothetical protein GCM10012278_30780 [Nonomuraea glycinis]|uniref:Uncharacterized protein n=1 Tax=Nonomuraea glycinis TaxID=2047744 RepID=A0A918E5L9_9ACTN|nr:hypothetical protein GCM10012278_30780 [Nonomuraea glycinis]